ncbi:hypothetical protein G4Y79_00965 [Phototrophicus methaneseepsis]|uniref:Uncharacterized protein n=1 Tax=Phototrophicus methaneseepsis TaxID=2710758 RepID=A0A7S8E9S0_9CHLR|nr:hypothetical protein [Phototrophicus methaneseepsis]QPC82976.1 hypothetical protein G4Y79_00965 [Phototrophicus methaneseepsis]
MVFRPLEHNQAYANYDDTTGIVYVTYRGNLDAETSTAVYSWLNGLLNMVGAESIYGEIWDFREVEQFMPDNLQDARKNSRIMNLKQDTGRFPVAMIIKDYYQEEILRGPMKNVPENQRKAIVRSVQEGLAFIKEWHTMQSTSE